MNEAFFGPLVSAEGAEELEVGQTDMWTDGERGSAMGKGGI